jgi:hypothetical protein
MFGGSKRGTIHEQLVRDTECPKKGKGAVVRLQAMKVKRESKG